MESIKQAVIDYSLKMVKDGLTTGTGGNVSIKDNDKIFITPTGVDYNCLDCDDISELDLEGNFLGNGKKPSSEYAFHCGIYAKRNDVKCIIHTHSLYATVLACLKKELPPIHYLVGLSGKKVPVADYALFGTKELSNNILSVMEDYNAVLLANHGLVCMGKTPDQAYSIALNIEFACKVYVLSMSAGTPINLTDDQINEVQNRLNNYMNPYFSKG